MNSTMRCCVSLIVMSMLLSTTRQARADTLEDAAIGFYTAIAVAAVGITMGVALIVRHKPSITGCVTQGSDGLMLQNERNSKSYELHGNTVAIKPGERVKVSGKHPKNNLAEFDVIELKKSYGACSVPSHS